LIVKRSIKISDYNTSVSVEDAFWNGLCEIAKAHKKSVAQLIREIDEARHHANLSSAIRIYVFEQLRAKTRAESDHSGDTKQPNGPTSPD
jgi:predicted DNA-binding ribbon-helix-helix protein